MGQQLIFDGTAATVTVTGLSLGTQYYIKAYEYQRCGAGPYDYYYNVTTGTNIGNFTTCGVYTVPSLEDFTVFVPACWQLADNGDLVAGPSTFGTSSWVADGFGNVGTTGAMRINIDATGDNDWILSPLYTIPATGYELKFDASANQWASTNAPTTPWEADDFVEVLVSTGIANWTVLYTYNNTNVPSNTGTPNIINLDAYAGQTVRFAFRGVEGAANGGADIEFIVDNFEIRLTPACIEPTTLAATNITTTSVNLSWVDPSGVQFDFEYAIQTPGTGAPVGAGTAIGANSVVGETLDINGVALTANTPYEVFVRADCGSDFSTWFGPINFRTPCNAITNLPHAESFDAATNPSCWSTALITGATNWAPDDSNDGVPAARTGARFAGKSWVGNDNALLISPVYNLVAYSTDQVRLNVWIHRSTNGLSTDRITFHANTTNNLTGATMLVDVPLPISAAPVVSEPGWYNYIVDLPLSFNTVGDFYIIAQGRTSSSFSSYGIGFDDYVLELSPSCLEPNTLIASNVTATSVDLSWVSPSVTQFDFEYAIQAPGAGIPAGAGSPVGDVSVVGEGFDINGNALTSNTSYEVYVRSDCGGGDFSPWVGPINFTTSIEVVCGTPVNTTYCYTDNDTTSWTFTSNTGDPLRLTFNAGQVENNWDELIVLDSDGVTELYNGYGAAGNLAGLTFDSTGDTIIVMISSDGFANCGDSLYTSWDFDVACATCVNPIATYTVVADCTNGQFSIDVDVTDIGSATSLTLTDGAATLQMITATGIQTFGPYADGSSATITITNEQDTSCFISSTIAYSCPPANDECDNSVALTVNADYLCGIFTSGTTVAATDSGVEPTLSISGTPDNDVWFSFVATQTAHRITLTNVVAVIGTGVDMGIGVFNGPCASLSLVGSSDPNTYNLTGLSIGNTYLVNVYGWYTAGASQANTTFDICVGTDPSLSSSSFNSNAFLAYPNPVKDVLNLEYSSEISFVRVMNLLGQEVISRNINANATQVDMSQLSSGAYIVNVTVGDAVKTIKVVKQ